MNRVELSRLIQTAETFAQLLRQLRGCEACMHCESGKHCAKYEMEIPPEHFPRGCDEWEFDGIPF